jgi:Transglycosylase SLT domain
MSFPAARLQRSARVFALATAALPMMAAAQGVPVADGKSIIQHVLEIAQMSYLTGGRELEADRKRRIDELHQDQLDALDATLAMMTGQTPWIGDLEVIPGADAEVLYAVEDNNPYAARLFGDAKTSIEEMIVATAQKYAGHPGLARAGLNPVEFRIWFQSLVKQESGFSIGARSPVGAFGLTQVMPGTAKDLGIYPAYYDDPMLQLDGGARYFLTQLNTLPPAFGNDLTQRLRHQRQRPPQLIHRCPLRLHHRRPTPVRSQGDLVHVCADLAQLVTDFLQARAVLPTELEET